jgi:hypothetical protein
VPRYALTVDLLKQLFLDGSLLEMPFEIGSDFPVEDGHGRRAAGSVADRNQKQPFGGRRRSGIRSVLGTQNGEHVIAGKPSPADF